MLTLFAHAGHVHNAESVDAAHGFFCCKSLAIGAAIVIAILLSIIVYLLIKWQPKSKTKAARKKA